MHRQSSTNTLGLTKHIAKAGAIISLCAIAFTASHVSQAQTIYKTVHPDGTVTYSDSPSKGAIEVTLDVTTNTIKSANIPKAAIPQTTKKTKANYQLSILSPQPEATIRNNLGRVNIAAAIEPRVNGVFQLHINDDVIDSPTGVFSLKNMHRGSYQYTVKFIDTSGKVIASTPSRNLYLHKASALINQTR